MQVVQVNSFSINAYKFWPNDSWHTTNILDCSCHFDGSLKTDGSVCISTDPCPCSNDGTCNCGIGFKGDKCDECEPGYYDIDVNDFTSGASCTGIFPYTPEKKAYFKINDLCKSIDCDCNIDGSLKEDGSVCLSSEICPCDSNGLCTCGINYYGDKCEKCEKGFYDSDGNNSDTNATCTGN